MSVAVGQAYLRRLALLGRDVRWFLVSSALFGFTIMNGIYPVLYNLYLLRLGYTPAFVGTVNAVGLLAFALSAFPAGAIARRMGLHRAMALGVALAAVCSGLQPMVEFLPRVWYVPWLLGYRVLGSVGFALYMVNSVPFLSDATTPPERPHVYSARMAFDTLSGFLGSLSGGLLPGWVASWLGTTLAHPAPYRWSLFAAAGLCLPGVAALLAVGEKRSRGKAGPGAVVLPEGTAPVALIALMALVVLLRTSSFGTTLTFFNVYLDDGLGVSTARIGAITAIIQLTAVPVVLIMPRLIARWGPHRVILNGSLGVAASMLPLSLISHWAAAAVGRLGVYVLSSVVDPALSIYQMELVPPRWRPLMAGATSTAVGIGWTALAFGGGYLITWLDYRALFLGAGVLTAGGALLFWLFFRHERPASLT